jgi:glycosyltransferase involved in cell wall biosynthesis
MRVCIDGFIYAIQRHGGVSRYVTELVSNLPNEVELCLILPKGIDVTSITQRKVKVIRSNPWRFKGAELWRRIECLWIRLRVAWYSPDVIHLCYYESLLHGEFPVKSQHLLLTVHDFIWKSRPEDFVDSGRQIQVQKRAIEAASGLICVSNFTRLDLERYHAVDPAIVSVVGLAGFPTNIGALRGDCADVKIPCDRFFLYVGGRAKYKGFEKALLALMFAAKSIGNVGLVVAGSQPTASELQLVGRFGLEGIVTFVGAASDHALASFYRKSLALIYPSEHEGFGIPLVEAMEMETAVIACRCSSVSEVVGQGGLLVKPGNVEDLAEAMISVATNPDLRRELVAAGRREATRFGWERTASATAEVYRRFVENGRRAGDKSGCLKEIECH